MAANIKDLNDILSEKWIIIRMTPIRKSDSRNLAAYRLLREAV